MIEIPETIPLAFGDGVVVLTARTLVEKFRTVYDVIGELGVNGDFPVPNVSSTLFTHIKNYSNIEDALVYIPPENLSPRDRPKEIADFFETLQRNYAPPINPVTGRPLKQNTIVFELINAANYLNYNLPKLEGGRFQKGALLQEAAREIAMQIMGKAPDQLKEAFDIECNVSEIEAEVLKEVGIDPVGGL